MRGKYVINRPVYPNYFTHKKPTKYDKNLIFLKNKGKNPKLKGKIQNNRRNKNEVDKGSIRPPSIASFPYIDALLREIVWD